MKKLVLLIVLGVGLGLAGCGDPGGYYPDMVCTARDIERGYCTTVTFSCSSSSKGPLIVTYHSHGIVRCK